MNFQISELVGWALGWLLAPAAAAGSAARGARVLHPAGVIYKARVEPIAREGALGEAAARLEGDAIVRLSSALWRSKMELPDVLGFAVRIQGPRALSGSGEPQPGDQDILFATIRRPFTMPFAPLTTNPHSFFRNDYYAVSPFEVEGVGRVRLRLCSPRAAADAEQGAGHKLGRDEELRRAALRGTALFRLEMRRQKLGSTWQPVASIRLLESADIDPAALRFWPFQTDRGVTPRGLVHALRRGVYWASQRAR